MKICLVKTPSPFLVDDKSFPPLGLMQVGTCLKAKGHDVIIHDGKLGDIPMGLDGYGFGPTTPEYAAALEGKAVIRFLNPRARIVLGGSFATLNQERVLSDGWDCVVAGDGEIASEYAFMGRRKLEMWPSQPLDHYPIIDRTLLDLSGYTYSLQGRKTTTVVTSRGCPWKCAFCCKTEYNNSVRMRSADHVNQEVNYLYDVFGYTGIHIPDDIFIIDRKRTEDIARHFKELGIIWRCLVRADLVVKYGESFVQMMAETGCIDVGMGIESGSNRILQNVNKSETVEIIKQAIWMLNYSGITVKGYFILGLPGESPETLAETEQFLAEMQLADVDIKIYQPYPGSDIFRNKTAYDIEWDDIPVEHQFYKGRQGDYHGTVRTSALANSDIVAAMNRMELRFKRV